MHKSDPKRFSIAIPKKVILSYPQIFYPIDGVAPSSERIISDTYGVLISIKYIVEAEGCIIPDVNNVKTTWKGRRREAWGIKEANHGGNRVRMSA